MRASVAWLLVIACGNDRAPPVAADAAPTDLLYEIVVNACEPMGRPARAQPPSVLIDGSAETELRIDYPSEAAAIAVDHAVELRFGSAVIASLPIAGNDLAVECGSDVATYAEDVCEYDSGDLRFAGTQGDTHGSAGETGECIGDPAGAPCTQTSCGSAMKCTAIVTLESPLFSHLGCAPSGSAAVGSACTLLPGSDGEHDDCDPSGLCLAGTCHELCGTSCDLCAFADGVPPELSFCM